MSKYTINTRECSLHDLEPNLAEKIRRLFAPNDSIIICCQTELTGKHSPFVRFAGGEGVKTWFSTFVVTQSQVIDALHMEKNEEFLIASTRLTDIFAVQVTRAEHYVVQVQLQGTARAFPFSTQQLATKFTHVLRQAIQDGKIISREALDQSSSTDVKDQKHETTQLYLDTLSRDTGFRNLVTETLPTGIPLTMDKRVLVADDSEAIREMLGSFLANMGYHVDLAENGQVAVDLFKAHPYDVLILDLQMPRLIGIEVLAQIKAIDPDVQVIIVTGHATMETAIQALRLGAYEYLFKPIEDMEDIVRLVHRAYHHRCLLRENKLLLRELIKANTDLMELDKRKSQFLSMVSHELRSPLATIKLCLQGALDGLYGPMVEKQTKRFELALCKVKEEEYLVENLLDLVRIEADRVSVSLAPQDLVKVIQAVVEEFRPRALAKRLDLRSKFPSETLIAYIDENGIRRVVANLVDNAIKFTDRGSIIVTGSVEGDNTRLMVADTGIGIPQEERDKIFERFYRVDNSLTRQVGGTGIGLSIVKKYVELHKGQIDIESKLGEGTQVTVLLPRTPSGASTE